MEVVLSICLGVGLSAACGFRVPKVGDWRLTTRFRVVRPTYWTALVRSLTPLGAVSRMPAPFPRGRRGSPSKIKGLELLWQCRINAFAFG